MHILVGPRGRLWYNEYPGAMVIKQVNHGILARHRMRNCLCLTMSRLRYNYEQWNDDVPSCGGTMNSCGGKMNFIGGMTEISSSCGMISYFVVQ